MYNQNTNQLSLVEDPAATDPARKRSVYLEGAQPFYHTSLNKITKVAPAPGGYTNGPPNGFQKSDVDSSCYDTLKPVLALLRIMGIFPISNQGQIFQVTPQWMIYSSVVFLFVLGYIGYTRWDRVEMVRSAEGRFEEAVIDYLFTVYLIPIIINPISWYEARKQATVLTNLVSFERMYSKISKKKMRIFLGNRPLITAIGLPIFSIATMVVTHITMVHFRFIQVVPYCYINTITYLVGGAWYIYCDLIGKVATIVASDFQQALKNIGPSTRVADYRSMWMMLSKIIRDVANATGYMVTFLCLYLFLVITLTIYGLLSQIQEGLGVKDIGLAITACFSIALLFFLCDEAHYASNCVRVQFQKKLLLVELNWMNDDAQQEINMFVRATEMNPTDMSLCGFFDVNRNLFKSLIATMVTYLVVLLQFQISIPEDTSAGETTATTAVTAKTTDGN